MNVKSTLVIGALAGFVVGVVFIFVQPFFGMSPLTDRHAAEYTKLSNITPSMAIIIAWAAHLAVSVAYGIVTGVALFTGRNLAIFALIVAALGWFTTVIAGPANALIIRIVTSRAFPSFDSLPPWNFNLDAKLTLHLIFFAAIALILLAVRLVKAK